MRSACILSGGKSSRMGRNKAFLPVGGLPNIRRIVETLRPHFPDICLVTNDPEAYEDLGLPTTRDRYPGQGPVAGVHAGLLLARFDRVFVVANDMPFVSADVALRLVELSEGYDAAVPEVGGQVHTLYAVYRKETAPHFEAVLLEGRRRMVDVYERIRVRYVRAEELGLTSEEAERIFFNMNTPEEYARVLAWTEEGEPRA
ncbi:MAG: molybdenum cofactor guanylyltransferase [Brockia lithotrophica]|nr:molybdenum cofactor guanylyltransferase [Brockia lithotrophica]